MPPKPFVPAKRHKRQPRVNSAIPFKTDAKTNAIRYQVTLLLAAGHQYQITLQSDDPLLHQLFQVMLIKTQPKSQATPVPPQLLQIPINQGQASLCIASTDLIGVITEPALFIKPHSVTPQAIPQPPLSQSSLQPQSAEQTLFLPAQFIQIEQFLSPANHAAALQIALTKQAEFVGSTTTTSAEDYRQSAILYATLYPDFYHLLRQQILAVVPTVLQQLQMPEFEVAEVEMQMTAHNDGCFYKIHNDSGDTPTRTRRLTYVYYFHQDPQAFSGGELKIYDTELKQGGQQALDVAQTVIPKNNSIVFFDSHLMHEVLPVACPSRAFANSRFTLNGWLRRAK